MNKLITIAGIDDVKPGVLLRSKAAVQRGIPAIEKSRLRAGQTHQSLGRMRLTSSDEVIRVAQRVAPLVVEAYAAPGQVLR